MLQFVEGFNNFLSREAMDMVQKIDRFWYDSVESYSFENLLW